MMATASSSAAGIQSSAQSPSQSSSPTSPTGAFFTQGAKPAPALVASRRTGSRPSTPVQALGTNGLLDSPLPGMSYANFVRSWTDQHVARWLTEVKCSSHAATFKANDIRGDVILDLDQQTLKEMGIASIGDRLRIINAVKVLRQKCSTKALALPAATNGSSSNGRISPKVQLNGEDHIDPFRDGHDTQTGSIQDNNDTTTSHRHRGRPAPLQLQNAQHAQPGLPRIIRDSQSGPDSARSSSTTATTVRPLPQPSMSSMSSSVSSASSATSSSSRSILPPLPPPPRSQPPLPPTNPRQTTRLQALASQQPGRRTPTQTEAPHFTSQPLPLPPAPGQGSQLLTSSTAMPGGGPWKGEYGLPSAPRPGNLGGGTPGRSTSPLPPAGSRASPSGHAKTSSYSGTASSPASKGPSRPATGNGTSSHPYALSPPQLTGAHNLSPIAESFMSNHSHSTSTSGTPSPPTATSSSSSNAYTVGRGPFGRPTTPSHSAAPSLEDLRRKLVKFFLADDGHSVTINVADCAGGIEVLEKALKKFGKLGGARPTDAEIASGCLETEDGGLCVDGWGVYLDWGQDSGPGKPLRESELLSVCHAGPDHPAREHGLTLRRTGKAKRSKALQQIFGEPPPQPGQPSSPSSPLFVGPKLSTGDVDEDGNLLSPGLSKMTFATPANASLDLKSTKRASSISVLSALGVVHPERVLEPAEPTSPTTAVPQIITPPQGGSAAASGSGSGSGKSPSASTFAGKIRQFLARPPSEVITNHLTEFFPYTERKVLQKTARQSMMRVSGIGGFGKRDSTASWNRSRFSSSTDGSHQRMSMSPNRVSMVSLPPTATPERQQAYVADGSLSTSDLSAGEPESDAPRRSTESKSGHLLPPVKFPTESFSESFDTVTDVRTGVNQTMGRTMSNASRRMSYMTELRSKRDRSDTASMITVDEITAEVESRRKSMAVESLRSEESIDGDTAIDSVDETDPVSRRQSLAISLRRSGEIMEEELDEEDEMEEGEEDEGDVEEDTLINDDDPVAMTSTGGKRAIKWIRGALIGAGSFGSVYLGMDAMSGLLMAVKQVELPSGSGPNEERKKSMLSALEREIDLLKDLQHENIVQYLDSSSDEEHLNIFLEYVPGGSVTALLRSYGAFEEALVRNFVRQILQGLNYLHEREIIHRDIKGANILVDNKGGIKISDFGISKKVEDNLLTGARMHRPSLQGSVFWMAPEVVKQTSYTRKADIWSVGCLVVEMLTGQHPWAQLTQMQAIFKIGSMAKPTMPQGISADAVDFLERTFDIDYEARPTAAELLQHPWIVKDPAATAPRPKAAKAT